MAEAVPHWQRGVVAVGVLTDSPGMRPTLMGSGFIIDTDAGIVATCAHVMDVIMSRADFAHIVVGVDSPIEWQYRAVVRRLSPPPAPRDARNGLDLALLQLTADIDGGPLNLGGLVALPLGDSDQLQPGEPLVVLGYGQPESKLTQTATVTRGVFSARYEDESRHRTGSWLRTDSLVLGGHSGGPALDRRGRVAGWNVLSAMDRMQAQVQVQVQVGGHAGRGQGTASGWVPSGLNELRPINSMLDEVAVLLGALLPLRCSPSVQAQLRGAIPPGTHVLEQVGAQALAEQAAVQAAPLAAAQAAPLAAAQAAPLAAAAALELIAAANHGYAAPGPSNADAGTPSDHKRQRYRNLVPDVGSLSLATPIDGVPSLPEQYEPRAQLEATHRDALLRAGSHAITAATTGVSGPAGAGKSTMAIVLAHDPLVHAHFPDGVDWLAFGRERTGAEVLRTLAGRLDVVAVAHEELHVTISRALAGQRRLLVLDDIWTEEQQAAFAPLTAEGGLLGRLVTTRNDELAGEHAHKVEALKEEEALGVLAGYMGAKAAKQLQGGDAKRLVEMCCGNPAMLRSVAALCKKKGVTQTLAYLEKCRQKLNLAKLPMAGDYEYRTLFDALGGMLQFLGEENPQLAERCTMLAVFREDSRVPLAVVGQLWGVDAVEMEEAVTELESWHLVDVDWEGPTLSLIDLHLDYLRASAKEDLARWHAALLRGCGRRTLGNHFEKEREEDDAYWGERANVVHHMRGCGWAPGALGSELTDLRLESQGLGDVGAKGVAAMVKSRGSLAELRLGYNEIGDEGAKALAAAVASSGSLVKLHLHENRIGNEGAKALAAGVADSGSLVTLSLNANKIGDEGAKALAAGVASSGSLATLWLNSNSIGVLGAKALAAGVASSGSLVTLNLNFNSIDDEGAKALAEAVSVSGSMVRLDLRLNSIDGSWTAGPGRQALRDAAKQSLRDAVQGRQGFELLV